MSSTTASAALDYAAKGWAVFPCRDKRPLTTHGLKDATSDHEAVRQLWESWPDAQIGLPTGENIRAFVLDIDLPEGPASLAALESKHGKLPATKSARTKSGGTHIYFALPEGRQIKNSVRFEPGLDIRGNGGYVIAPPSSGYAWTSNGTQIAEAPGWLLDMVAPVPKAPPSSPSRPTMNAIGSTPYGRKALEYEAENVATAPQGERNHTLNAAAFKCGGLVAGGELDRHEAESALYDAALSAGLSDHEARTTIGSGINAGAREPRRAPESVRAGGLSACKGEPEPDHAARETLTIEDGKLPEIVDRCEGLLMQPDLAPEHRIFQRGGQLVRIASIPSSGFQAGVGRPQGSVVIAAVDRVYLQDVLGRIGNFRRYDGRSKGFKHVDVPKSLAETLLARKGLWRFPSLRGVIVCPTVRADGSLLNLEGYDDSSGFFLAQGLRVNVPNVPARGEAASALETLNSLLVAFPFVSDVDRAVALSLILSGIVRPAVETTPLFTVTAPVRGSGKSTLVDIAAVLATGRRAAVVAAASDQQELRKRLESCLLSGDSMVSLDNLNGVLNSDLLCQATTQAAVKVRPLGVSVQQEVPNTAVFAANGNNLVVAGDLARRTLMCKLDPNCERPEERVFTFDPVAEALRRRAGYVEAALIILRGYIAAGRPELGLSKFGSFEQWSDLVRSSLVWAGASDPCDSRTAIIDDDPELSTLEAVLSAWMERFGSKLQTVQEIVNVAQLDENSPLAEAIGDVAANDRGLINKQKLGLWCRRNAGRIAAGLRLQRSTLPGASAQWKVVSAV